MAGVLPLGEALRMLAEQCVPASVEPNLLEPWELHRQGSPVVSDRRRPGRMVRPVQRMLAVTGPVEPAAVLKGLNRTRSASYSPDPMPTEELLLAWAEEHSPSRCRAAASDWPAPTPPRS